MTDRKTFTNALSPNLLFKNLQSLERGTTWIIGISWLMAILLLGFAVYTLHLSKEAKQDVIIMTASEAKLPDIQHQTVNLSSDQTLISQLQKRYPDIHVVGQETNLVITASDGANFREWLEALDYVDALAPDWRWSLQAFCVGKCPGRDLMYAVVSAESIKFSMP